MDGIFLVDKPSGPTSHDVVARVRRLVGQRRVGHAGTLDPLASGLLVLGLGRYTRLLRFVEGQHKHYDVTALLGLCTDTGDVLGRPCREHAVAVPQREVLEAAARRFVPGYAQRPPRYSARKVDGERAYRRARRGEAFELARRYVAIDEVAVTGLEPVGDKVAVSLRVACGPGTYVRSFVEDLGAALDCCAAVASLRRVSIGHLSLRDAVAPEQVAVSEPISLERALGLGVVHLEDPAEASAFVHGGVVRAPRELGGAHGSIGEREVLVVSAGTALGVALVAEGRLVPRVVVVAAEELSR